MKNKLRIICKYLKGMGIEKAEFRVDLDSDGIQWFDLDVPYDISDTIESSIRDIIELYSDKLYDYGPGTLDSSSDYYYVNGEIITNENKLIFIDIEYQGYETEGSGSYYDIDDYEEDDTEYGYFIEVRKFLDTIKSDSVTIHYEGSGDSGAIDNDYTTEDGQSGMVPTEIEDLCYRLLSEYGGWEINEGSEGNIILSRNEIEVEHAWNTIEDYSDELNIVITPETFSEQSK